MQSSVDLVTAFVEAYDAGDRERMRVLLADEIVGYATAAEATVDRADGADTDLPRLPNPHDAESRSG